MTGSEAAKAVYLHVGAPTAGGAFLQKALWDNRKRLGASGVRHPVEGPLEHFGAVMDLRDMTWGGHRDPAWEGAWEAVARRARDWHGHAVVLSQELLGGATAEQAARAVESFGDAEVHVVFVTRDLGTQLVLDWQEQILHTHTISFGQFTGDLIEHGIDAPEPYGEMFWGLHDPLRVLGTWGTVVPRERIHVITLPAPGTGPELLWSRFCEATGIDPGACDVSGVPDAEPLSVVEAELLRRLNGRLAPALGGDYERVVRRHLTGSALAEAAGAAGRAPMGLPPGQAAWAAQRTREIVASLRVSGYRVHGDLAELTEPGGPASPLQPRDLPEDDLAEAALSVIVQLLERLAAARERVGLAQLRADLNGVQEGLDKLLEVATAQPAPGLRKVVRRAGMGR
jgi:hypothetical protein